MALVTKVTAMRKKVQRLQGLHEIAFPENGPSMGISRSLESMMINSVSRLLFSVVSVISLLVTLSHAQQAPAIQGQVMMRAADRAQVRQPWSGATQLAASTLDTFFGTIRFPAELNNQFFQPQQNDTAYFRDFFTGGFTEDQGVDGQSISAQLVTADNQTISFSPITFFATLNGAHDCWVGFGSTICNAPILDVFWFAQTQCFRTGTFIMTFFRQGTPFAKRGYQIKPTVPPHTVPGDSNDPVPGDPVASYDQNFYSGVQYGNFCSFTVVVNTPRGPQTREEIADCKEPPAGASLPGTTASIGKLGCALTDLTMVLGYFGAFTDAPTLNEFLTKNDGYDDVGGINWPVVTRYAASRNLQLSYSGRTNDVTIGGDFLRTPTCSKGPTLVKVQHTVGTSPRVHNHFVTVWGQDGDPATVSNTFFLKDPMTGTGDLLSGTVPPANYDNISRGTRQFQGPDLNTVIQTFNGSVTVKIHSPAELLITNSAGQKTGLDPITHTSFAQIPNAVYLNDSITDPNDGSDNPAESDTKSLDLGAPPPDTFTLTVTGTDFGSYRLEFLSFDPNFKLTAARIRDVPTSPGSVQMFTFTTPIVTGQPFPLSGGFDGGGQSAEVDHFLTYANPTKARTTLPTGTTTFPLFVFYDTHDIASSFAAVLNGISVSNLFHPTPGTFEVVNIPLTAGTNVLKLSISGNLPGRVATDTDRLVFDVD